MLDPERAAAGDALRDLGGAAGVAPDDSLFAAWEWNGGGGCVAPLHLTLASGSDCVLLVKPVPGARRARRRDAATRVLRR